MQGGSILVVFFAECNVIHGAFGGRGDILCPDQLYFTVLVCVDADEVSASLFAEEGALSVMCAWKVPDSDSCSLAV